MSYVAAGVAVAGAVTSYVGSEKAAGAASSAASAMQDASGAWLRSVRDQRDKAVSMVNTPSQIAAYDQALQGQEQNVRRQEALVQSLDPNIIEAGKQTAQLLAGKSAPVLQNLTQQRQLQRDQLVSQLQSQMGPGAQTSTAGQQALNQFDTQTSNILNSTQQEYLDKVSGMALGGAATLGQSLSQVHSVLSTMQTQSPGAQAADLIAKFTAAESGAQQAQVESAGGQFAGDQIKGQEMSNLGNTAMSLGAMFAGKQMLSKPGASPGGPAQAAPDGTGSGFSQDQLSQERSRMDMQTAGGFGPSGGNPPSALGNSIISPARSGISSNMPNPGAASDLGFSSNYGGGGNNAYNLNPRTWQNPDITSFAGPLTNPRYSNIAGGQ